MLPSCALVAIEAPLDTSAVIMMRKRKRAQESGIVVISIRILECKLFLGGLRWQDIKVCNTSEFAVALTASGNVDMADQSTMGCASIIDSQNHWRWSLSWKKPRKILVFSSEGAQQSLRSGRFSARFFYFTQYITPGTPVNAQFLRINESSDLGLIRLKKITDLNF